jgi:hypothetical protein
VSAHLVAAQVGGDHALIVTSTSRELRRTLGVVAWSVLEDIALDARCDGCGLVAATNVRRIAEHLGVSKDTAARAVARLIDADLVTRTPTARTADGTFAGSGYRLEVERLDAVFRIAAPPGRDPGTPPVTRPGRTRAKASARPARQDQAALFDLDQAVTR